MATDSDFARLEAESNLMPIERRQEDTEAKHLMRELYVEVSRLRQAMKGRTLEDLENTFNDKLREHEQRELQATKDMIQSFSDTAFPDGPIPHKEAHLHMIHAAKTEAEFWQQMKIEIGKKSIWGILQLLLLLVGIGLAAKFGLTNFFGAPR